jgi:uncharacterized membrane protein
LEKYHYVWLKNWRVKLNRLIMKKTILIFLTSALITINCTPKASPAVTEATIPSETKVSNDAATIDAGHTIFTTKCTHCHGQKPIHKWTYEKLRPILGSMVQKAKLNSEEIGQISAYVHANCKK